MIGRPGHESESPSTRRTEDAHRLKDWFSDYESVVVAFSGGVDSSVVLAAALACKSESGKLKSVTAITAKSPSVPEWQLDLARDVAETIGADHQFIATREVERSDYQANDAQRCFHCKSTLYAAIGELFSTQDFADAVLVSGTNADDLGDYRPGIRAGDLAGIRKPLAELGLGKPSVRALAQIFGLPNADVPASPCLASRIAYGVKVTPERLRRIELAEDYLRQQGFVEFRVRLHQGELARIEVAADQIAKLTDETLRSAVTYHLSELGFRYVTVDLYGFQSGSMNRQLVSLQQPGNGNPLNLREHP